MTNLLTAKGSNGDDLQAVQPVTDSVTGSPFTAGASASATPELSEGAVMIAASQNINIRFNDNGATDAASADSMVLFSGRNYVFPVQSGQVISMIRNGSTDATVWIEQAKVIGDT